MKYVGVFIDYFFAAFGAWVLTEYAVGGYSFYDVFVVLLLLSIMIGQAEAKHKEDKP